MQLLQTARAIKQKQNFKEFFSRVFSGRISPYVAAACVGSRITPNALTISMIPVGLLGAVLMALGGREGLFFGALCFVALNIIDAADGELARFNGIASDFGDFLDRVAHYATNTAFIMGLSVGTYFLTQNIVCLIVGFAANSAVVADDALRDLLITCGLERPPDAEQSRKDIKRKTHIGNGRILSFVGLLFNNIAAFHFVTLLAAVDLFLAPSNLVTIYFFCYCLATIAKSVVRCRLILRQYG